MLGRIFGGKGALAPSGGGGGGSAGSVSSQTAEIASGAMTPANSRRMSGIYTSAEMMRVAEQMNLKIDSFMASHSEKIKQEAKETAGHARVYFSNVKKVNDYEVKIQDYYTDAKAHVVQGDLKKHQLNNRFLDSANRAAAGYQGERNQMQQRANKINQRLQKWEGKMRQLEAAR